MPSLNDIVGCFAIDGITARSLFRHNIYILPLVMDFLVLARSLGCIIIPLEYVLFSLLHDQIVYSDEIIYTRRLALFKI